MIEANLPWEKILTNSQRKAHVKKKQTQKRNLKQNQPSHDTFKEKN